MDNIDGIENYVKFSENLEITLHIIYNFSDTNNNNKQVLFLSKKKKGSVIRPSSLQRTLILLHVKFIFT